MALTKGPPLQPFYWKVTDGFARLKRRALQDAPVFLTAAGVRTLIKGGNYNTIKKILIGVGVNN